jgi:hypothetical protein
MRYLSIIILALVANIASAQQVNPVTDYTFANRMSSGRSTVTDTAAYFSIGPRYGAVRGMMPPMVTDTVAMSANKRNGLLIFSIQKNKYQVWDSAGAKWADITGAAGSAIISADTAAMLLPYLRKADTTAMLLPYLRKSDTLWLSNRINLKLNISDTSSMLNPYLRGSGTANYFPKFNASRSVINSKLYESGTNLLFNTTNPSFTSAGITTIENNATSSAVYTYKIADTIRAYMGYGGSSTFDINNLKAGDIRFYTNAQLRGRFQTDGTFRLNSLTGTGSRIVTADADGVLSATSSATGLVDTLVLSTRSWRQKGIDSVSANVALKVNISDTSSMLTNYIRHAGNGLTKSGQALSVDTAAIATRARVQKAIDSVATLASAGVTSVATGYGLSGGTITTTGTISADTAIVASRLRVGKVVDSLALVKVNISDTSSMLTNYLRGTGNTNYIPKFTSSRSFGNSLMYEINNGIAINTLGPIYAKLQIAANGSGIQDALILENTNTAAANLGTALTFAGTGTAAQTIIRSAWEGASTDNSYMSFLTKGSGSVLERMRITSSGELLLNTTTDAGAYTLQVSGNTYVTGTTVLAATSGSVGIGTTPSYPLHVKGPALDYVGVFFANTQYLALGQYNVASGTMSVETGGNLAFLSGGATEGMRLTSARELLIATTTDAGDYKLQVSGNAYVTGTTVSQNVVASAASGPGFTSLLTTTDGQRIRMIMDGTNGVIEATRLSGTQPNMIFRTEGVEAMRLNPTRELILASDGSDAGDYKLQVVGNLYNTANAALSATSGTVSIGNTSFGTYKLNVSGTGNFAQSAGGGSTTATALLLTNTSDATTNGVRLSFQQSGATYETSYITALRVGTQSYTSLVFATGESGWNTAAPTEKIRMHYNGGIKFVGQSAAPTAEAGTVYYDTDDNKLKVYNGTTWVDLH